jgi:hypothetical protein
MGCLKFFGFLDWYGFAFHVQICADPGYNTSNHNYDYSEYVSLVNISEAVMSDFPGRVRRIGGPYSYIAEDEYRVALRVLSETKSSKLSDFDYHFLVQLSNGMWASKTPNGVMCHFNDVFSISAWTYGNSSYDSHFIFFAVQRMEG